MKWISRITPFIIVCILVVFGMLYFLVAERNSPAEVRYMYLVLLLPVTIGMVVVDLFLWRGIKKQRIWIWLIEVVLLLAIIYFWIIKD